MEHPCYRQLKVKKIQNINGFTVGGNLTDNVRYMTDGSSCMFIS